MSVTRTASEVVYFQRVIDTSRYDVASEFLRLFDRMIMIQQDTELSGTAVF